MILQTKGWSIVVAGIIGAVILGGTTYPLVRHMSFGEQSTQEYDQAIQRQKQSHVPSGFLVQSVPFFSKANRVRLKPGDVITKYNGLPVTNIGTYHYGWHLLLRTRGEVYESRKNHAAAAADFRKSIELVTDHDDSHLRMQYLLALARMNNLERFEEGVAFCNKYPTESYSARPYDVDALRAYVLVGNGDEAKARAAVEKWRNDSDAQKWFLYYWADDPNTSDVVDMWNRLMK